MKKINKKNNWHAVWFLLTFLGVTLAMTRVNQTPFDYRNMPINLRDIPVGSVLKFVGLHDRVSQRVRIGNMERNEPPVVGIFGDHTGQYFPAQVFGSADANYFFNSIINSATLPELVDFMAHMAAINKLPKFVLFQISNPRINDGKLLVTRRTFSDSDIFHSSSILQSDANIFARIIGQSVSRFKKFRG